MTLAKKILLFTPWFLTTLVITFLPIHHIWIQPVLFLALIVTSSFQREIRLESGKLRIRKRIELALCFVFFLLSLHNLNSFFVFWPAVPFFMLLVWMDFSVWSLLLVMATYTAFSNWWFHAPWIIHQYFALILSTAGAVLFRSLQRNKEKLLQKKLNAFETFEKKLTSGLGTTDSVAPLQSRTDSKIGELVQQQDKRFEHFIDLIYSTFNPHSVLIYTFDPLNENFHLQAHQSVSDHIQATPSKMEGLFMAVKSQGSVNFYSQTEIKHLPFYKKTPRLVSVAAVPIYQQDLLAGVIIVDHENRAFTKKEMQELEKFATAVADFIQDAETIYSFFRLKEELASFYIASSALNQAFHLQDVFDIFLKTSRAIVAYDLAFLVMWDQDTKYNMIVAQHGDFENLIGETFALAPTKGLVSWVIENRKPLSYDSYRQRQEHSPIFHKKMKLPNLFQSLSLFPLAMKEEVLGAVVFLSQKNGFFSLSTRKILEVLSIQASIAMKNAKMVRDLEQLATTDGLTGLINHRTFQKQLIHEIERARRTHTSVSLMMVDLDHFKKINDNYGHPMGDFVLKEVAAFLQKSVRNVDYVARYGGEEFAIILPDTTSEEAHAMAKRMGVAIQKKEMIDQGITLRITFSIGIAMYPDDTMVKEQLIDFADTALYHSKKAGRNRATQFTKDLKMVDFAEKEHRLIQRAEKMLQEQ